MDVPNRIAKSTAAGAPFGLTPKKYQSGEKDVTGVTRASAENGMITMAAPPMSLRGHFRPIEPVLPAGSCLLHSESVPLWLRVNEYTP
jgi:hypothetical protein